MEKVDVNNSLLLIINPTEDEGGQRGAKRTLDREGINGKEGNERSGKTRGPSTSRKHVDD